MVEGGHPQHHQQGQDHRQERDLFGGDAEDVADEQGVELGEALPPQGAEEDAQCHRRRGEDADGRVAGHAGLLPHQGKQQGDDHSEDHRRPGGLAEAAQGADGHAGEGGVPQGVGEEGHPALHHHSGQETEQGRDDQHRQQGVFHEEHGARSRPLKGQEGHQPVPEAHGAVPPSSSRFRWNTD